MNDTTRLLIPVGFYRELRGGKPHEPSMREAIQPASEPHEAKVVAYLKAGTLLIASGGVVRDVLEPASGMIGAPDILTDGVYAWPTIFAYYVERHHVRIPVDLASHMVANRWTVPADVDVRSLKIDRDRR